MWAPGFTQSPKRMGVVAMVTVTITSAPVTASRAEEQTRTGPLTEPANFTAFSLVRFHILTCRGKNKGKQNKDRLTWRISPCWNRALNFSVDKSFLKAGGFFPFNVLIQVSKFHECSATFECLFFDARITSPCRAVLIKCKCFWKIHLSESHQNVIQVWHIQ